MRENRMSTEMSNPATKFLSWKSNHQKFSYYDKTTQENVFLEMPVKFLALTRYKTVKGWNQKKEGAIISNEVKSLKDELVVNFYKKGDKQEIARGVWSDIKETVEMWNGRYTESVYAMMPDGELVNLQLSGASLSTWFEFQKNQSHRFYDEFVVVNGFKEGKSGAVTFTYPIFEWGGKMNASQKTLADAADDLVQRYEASYFKNSGNTQREKVSAAIEMLSDTFDAGVEEVKQPVPTKEADAKMVREMRDYDPDDLPF